MLSQPPSCFEIGCPLAGKAQGFVLGSGDPEKCKFSIVLEAPFREEVVWRVTDVAEIERRRAAYRSMPSEHIFRGQPVVGRSGGELFGWALAALGINREEVFVDNTLRCAMSLKEPTYPSGDVRKKAEACCRQYDRVNADLALVSIHPAAINREPTPLPLQIETFRRAAEAAKQGHKVVVLAGGKAAAAWFGAARNPTRWMGHYEWNDEATRARRELRIKEGREIVVREKGAKKAKKLTAKAALTLLLGKGICDRVDVYSFNFTLLKSEFDEMLALTQAKKREPKKKDERQMEIA